MPIDVAYDHTVKLENGELHTNKKKNLWARKKNSKSGHNKEQRKKIYRVYRLDQTTDKLQITVWLIISKSKGRF